VLIPLIYILPVFLEDNVQAVFLAEPIADVIAVATTLILFRKNFKKVLVEMKQKSETQDI
jgi:Na+-driven multidrug efflux pump